MSRSPISVSRRCSRNNIHSRIRPLRLEPLEPRIALSGSEVVELSTTPDAPTWIVAPYALSDTSTCMTVKQVDGMQYYFHNMSVGDDSHDSGWITETDNLAYFNYPSYVTYVDSRLTSGLTYTYEVMTRVQSTHEESTYSVAQSVTTLTGEVAQVQHLANQIRAIETFSSPDNPGQVGAQLTVNGYPNPLAPNNTQCEQSGTNGLAAYPGDGRNTPGAFQVDLANMGQDQPYAPWFKPFGVWEGTAASLKNASPNDTKIALSKTTLSEFFGIEVDLNGLITSIGAPAASVFLHDDALADATADVWSPTDNPLIGLHIDSFQSEQLSLYLAGRDPSDSSTGVTDSRTSPPEVMRLAETLQYQVSKSFMWGVYEKFVNHSAYAETFAKVIDLYGATLKITSSQGTEALPIFGIKKGEVFWCRLTPGFVLGGSYVSGEGSMFSLLTALVEANENGQGIWKVGADQSTWVTFTKEPAAAGTAAKDLVFKVDKTPLNVGETYPSIFHYGAVVSPFGTTDYTTDPVAFDVDMIDISDTPESKTAWGIEDRCVAGDLGYARLPAATTVTGSQTLTEGGNYIYKGLADGGMLTLTGAGTFVVNMPVEGPVVTTDGFPKISNNGQYVWGNTEAANPWVDREIDISDFVSKGLVTTNQDILNSSFYVWWDAAGQNIVAVRDATATYPENTPLQLYFMPEAKDMSIAEAVQAVREAIQSYVWQDTSPWYKSARVTAANRDIYGRSTDADEWATRFITTTPTQGTGTIDASGATGTVLIVANRTVSTVKLGSGYTTVLASQNNTGRLTYVLNPNLNTSQPTIALKANDLINTSAITKNRDWDAYATTTYSDSINVSRLSPPYLRYSYYAGWTGTQQSQTDATFQAIVLANTNTGTNDPAKIVQNALDPPQETINLASGQSQQTGASLLNFTVVFSEPVTDFDASDVTLNGPAATIDGASMVVTNPSGDQITYNVAVTLLDTASTGSVTATIADGVVHDTDGFTNLASTSTENIVTYVPNTITGQGESNITQVLGGGEPLPGVHVSLTSSTPGFTDRTTTTDSNGYYQFENVPDGTYQVTVTCPNACLDTGSDTATVNAEGSQTFEADFSFGALKASCIPNRIMVTSSLPIGSVQWQQVVQEALNLGNDTASQSEPPSTAEASQPTVTQYLVLAPPTTPSSTAVAEEEEADAAVVDADQIETESQAAEIEQPTVTADVTSSVAPIVDPVDTDAVDTACLLVAVQAEPIAQATVAQTVVLSEPPMVEEQTTEVIDTVQPQADNPPAQVAAPTVVPATMPSDVEAADQADAQTNSEPEVITEATVAPIVQEAIERWAAAGADQESLDKMQSATFLVSDLDGLYLGMTSGDTVWLDWNATGRGWFVDSTPSDDQEFSPALADGTLQAVASEAVDHVDLLTVVTHELGHIAGLDDSDLGGVMAPTLQMGTRLVPRVLDVVLADL